MPDHDPSDWSRFRGRIKRGRRELTTEELAAIGQRRSRLLDRVREVYGPALPAPNAPPADAAGAGHTGPRTAALA